MTIREVAGVFMLCLVKWQQDFGWSHHLGRLIEVICARFLHDEVILFPFVTDKYFRGKYSETANTLFLSKLSITL